jgi:hypothetical protein
MLTTLTTATEELSDMLGDFLNGTCTSQGGAAGATLIDTRLTDKSRDTDDYFNDQVIWITAGTSVAGDERYIKDFAKAGTITPYLAFSAQVPNASTYQIFKLWTATEYRKALNRAITDAYPWVSLLYADETLTTVADIWQYRLGDYNSGATATYAAGTLTDTGKAWQTNQFAGMTVKSGANSAVVASNTATVLTLAANWSPSTPTAADAYIIEHPITDVFDVSYQQDTTHTTRSYVSIPFEVYEHQGTEIIQLLAYPPVDRALRITGRGSLTEWTSTVTSTSEVGGKQLKLLYYLAAYHLFSRSPSLSPSQDRGFYHDEAQRYYALWERERGRRKTVTPPRRIWRTGMGMEGRLDDMEYLAANHTPGTS